MTERLKRRGSAGNRAASRLIDRDGAGPDPAALAERYLIGPDVAGLIDQVYAQENVSTGATTWLLSGNLGSTRETVDANGALTAHFNYNTFGQLVSGPTNITPFLFTGEFTDPATGLQLNAARWFDPAKGTWLSPDPADFGPGDANLTRYVLNQPTTFIDPSGLQAIRDISGAPLVYPQAATGSPAATAADAVFGAIGNQIVDKVDPPIIIDGGGGEGENGGSSGGVLMQVVGGGENGFGLGQPGIGDNGVGETPQARSALGQTAAASGAQAAGAAAIMAAGPKKDPAIHHPYAPKGPDSTGRNGRPVAHPIGTPIINAPYARPEPRRGPVLTWFRNLRSKVQANRARRERQNAVNRESRENQMMPEPNERGIKPDYPQGGGIPGFEGECKLNVNIPLN